MNREAAIAPYSSLCYRFCTSFEPKPQEIVMALFTKEESLAYHEEPRPGKLEVLPVKPCFTQKDLSMAYSPGVANACLAIADDPSLANAYTGRGNLVAVVSNGTAVLGLGNIGPLAGKPVMEGKSVLFKAFADVNAYDINLALTDPDKIIEVVKALEPTFGGIFACLPLLWILPFAKSALQMRVRQRKTRTIAGVVGVLIVSGVIIGVADAEVAGILQRYFADFSIMFLMAAVLIAFIINENLDHRSTLYGLFLRIMPVLVFVGVIYSVLLMRKKWSFSWRN